DDTELAGRLARDVHAFKVGINQPRSRGDRAEPFGGRGASWRGAFVGGELLVQAVTDGPPGEVLHGNFPDSARYPAAGSQGPVRALTLSRCAGPPARRP